MFEKRSSIKKFVIIIMIGIAIIGVFFIYPVAAPWFMNWETVIIDDEVKIDRSYSLILDDYDHPHIVYRDSIENTLMYATHSSESWSIQTVDSELPASVPSIILDDENNPHVSYRGFTTNTTTDFRDYEYVLKYAVWTGESWETEIVDQHWDYWEFTSISLDSNGNPRILYATWRHLKLASWYNNSWDIEYLIVEEKPAINHVSYTWDINDYLHISYPSMTDRSLRYAKRTGDSWDIEIVDGDSESTGLFSKIALDSDCNPHILYLDNANDHLIYTYKSEDTWNFETLKTTRHIPISLVIDQKDVVHIIFSYRHRNYPHERDLIKYATPSGRSWMEHDIESGIGFLSTTTDNDGKMHIIYRDFRNGDINYITGPYLNLQRTFLLCAILGVSSLILWIKKPYLIHRLEERKKVYDMDYGRWKIKRKD